MGTFTTFMTMVHPTPLFVLRVLSPSIVLLAALSLIFVRRRESTTSPITEITVATKVPRRAAALALLSLVSLTYLLDGLVFIIDAVVSKEWRLGTGIAINALIGVSAFSILAIVSAIKDVQGIDVYSKRRVKSSVFVSLALEIASVALMSQWLRHNADQPHTPEHRFPIPVSVHILHLALPAFRVLTLIPLLAVLALPRVVYNTVQAENDNDSTSSLLQHNVSVGLAAASDAHKYGTFGASTPAPPAGAQTPVNEVDVSSKPEPTLDPTWSEMLKRFARLTPYLWPHKSRSLQLTAALCIGLLILGRIVTAAVPFTLGGLVGSLETGATGKAWPYLLAYVGLRFLQGSGGLTALRSALWVKVMQYSDREMSQMVFDHLLNLSFAFHLRRKTGEILRILDRGAVINNSLELLLFNIVPIFIDIIVAVVLFVIYFDWTLAIVIFIVMVAYISASVILTTWRTKFRRQMVDRDVVTRGIHTDCLLNYETVKYFGGEEHEGDRYRNAIRDYQAMEYTVVLSMNILNLVQNFIISLGLLVGSSIVALRVTRGLSSAADFVVFITYLAQLYGPLNMLGTIYRQINQALVDTEKLLKLLDEPSEVNDKPGASELFVDQDAEIEFENVSFSYDGRTTALNGVSFKVPRGASVALVGESGSGKSTILRLLYRFYDLREGEGRILINGQDIRDVTQSSLRKAIGVVPQDAVLFNSAIGYNIGYGKLGASQEEIEAAAKAAQMHDRIISFPDGYDTKVGERGVRLSGGEKQRVAIARTLLKNPPILLLDEATSALDTSTEKDIQKALQNLMEGRSSLSIAHRLSTIAASDIILVLKDGKIVEAGNHHELLAQDGLFATMWNNQIRANEVPALGGKRASVREDSSTAVEPDVIVKAEDVEAAAPEEDAAEVAEEQDDAAATVEVAEVASPEPVEEPAAAPVPVPAAAAAAAPIAFPSSPVDDEPARPEPVEAEPVSFPGEEATSPPVSTPGITFEENSERQGTPDPEGAPKRKRISSQNFQRLAKRISISGKRQGSSNSITIPGFRRGGSGVGGESVTQSRGADEFGGRTSDVSSPPANNSTDSPAASIADSGNKKEKKKSKKTSK